RSPRRSPGRTPWTWPWWRSAGGPRSPPRSTRRCRRRTGRRSRHMRWPVSAPAGCSTPTASSCTPRWSSGRWRSTPTSCAARPPPPTVCPRLSAPDRAAMEAHAVAGECSGRLFDADGLELHAPLEERVVAVTLDQLRRTPTVIACGFGRATAAAARASVRGGFVGVLVLDTECARALAELTGIL